MNQRSNQDELKTIFNEITWNVVEYIESYEEVLSVQINLKNAALFSDMLAWEEKNVPYRLPEDLKCFYSTFNGVEMEWKVGVNGKDPVVGIIKVPEIKDLISSSKPFRTHSAAFLLSSDIDEGDTYLVYTVPRPTTGSSSSSGMRSYSESLSTFRSGSNLINMFETEIWFRDNNNEWHFICFTFTQYLRLMVVHLGIIGWQCAYTPEGLSVTTQEWMNIFCRERLCLDQHTLHKTNNHQVS